MSESEQREEAVFESALRLSADERAAYLERMCAGEDGLRRRVEILLNAFDRSGGFMKQPASPDRDAQASLPTEKPGDRIGRYKLLEQIGEGGCGIVYVAEQEEPVRRRVALKIIKLGMDTKEVVARFDAERQALAMMDHPNIARIHDAGATDTGRPFFVMELVKGIKITDYCEQHQLAPRERLDLFVQVCRAIQHAHQKGVIHRDIKPSNILVTSDDGVPVPKVIDFGIAKATQGRLTDQTVYTAFQQFIGTPAYMSPEQAQWSMQDIDTRSDIYSLGVLLYELLTGVPPFDPKELLAKGLDEMRRTIREVEPLKPSTRLTQLQTQSSKTPANTSIVNPHFAIDTDLDCIVMKCLEKDRSRRYETTIGLATDISRHLNNEAIIARAPSKLYELQKTFQRHKFGFTATAAIILALAGGLAISTRMYRKAETEAAKSEQVSQFLKDMLKGVGPNVALGRDTKLLREVLDQTAKRLSTDLTNQPAVEADLCETLGVVYHDISDFANAETMLRRSLRLRKGLYGDEDPRVASAMQNLADACVPLFKNDEAAQLFTNALVIRRKVYGEKSVEVADSLHGVAATTSASNPALAEQLYRETLAIYRQSPRCKLQLASTLTGLGLLLRSRPERLQEAEEVLREAVAIERQNLGEHPDLAGSLAELGLVLRSLPGKQDEGISVLREAVAIQKKFLGDHRSTALTLTFLAKTVKDPQESRRLKEEALAMTRKVLGEEHPYYQDLAVNLSDPITAESKLRAELTKLELKGDSTDRMATVWLKLGDNLRQQGRSADALAAFRKSLELRQQQPRSNPTEIVRAMWRISMQLITEHDYHESEMAARDALAFIDKNGLSDAKSLAGIHYRLAMALECQERDAEAESPLRRALTIQKKSFPVGDPEISKSLRLLGTVLNNQGRASEAEKCFEEASQNEAKAKSAAESSN